LIPESRAVLLADNGSVAKVVPVQVKPGNGGNSGDGGNGNGNGNGHSSPGQAIADAIKWVFDQLSSLLKHLF